MQTAGLLAQGLDYLREIRVAAQPRARPHSRASRADAVLAAGGAVIVVGHSPSIMGLGAHLLGRPAFPSFRTAQCYVLENGKPTWTARADIDQITPYFID